MSGLSTLKHVPFCSALITTKGVESGWVEVVTVLGFCAFLTLVRSILEWIKEKTLAGLKGMRQDRIGDSDQGENTLEQTKTYFNCTLL